MYKIYKFKGWRLCEPGDYYPVAMPSIDINKYTLYKFDSDAWGWTELKYHSQHSTFGEAYDIIHPRKRKGVR